MANDSITLTGSSAKDSPLIIQTEGSSFNIGLLLDETNYDIWSQLMEMHIAEKQKFSFIQSSAAIPKEGTPEFDKWYPDNQRVKRWLLMSMKPEIMKRYIRIPTAREIWKSLSTAFHDGADELQVFSLNQRAFSAKQDGRPISEFYGELTEIFSELDHRDKVVMENPNDMESYRKSIQRLRVHIFLAGLDNELEQIRGEILRKDPIPELESVYALVRREALRRQTMNITTETAAMVVRNQAHSNSNWRNSDKRSSSGNRPNDSGNRPNDSRGSTSKYPPCSVCGLTGHSKKGCYEIIGYPDWWKDSRSRRTSQTTEGGNKQASGLLTTTGTSGTALHSVSVLNNTWVIDSGATDHMTSNSKLVTPLNPSSQTFVSTANGAPVPVVGKGSVTLSDTLNLSSVLVVPSLDYNLLSVAQITNALHCVVTFWPSHCIFKDIQTKKTIGYGVRRGKLYYLDLEVKNKDRLHSALHTSTSERKIADELWLWHRRLGHASFGYLKKLFPNLVNNTDSSVFHCETCELAKSHRTSFKPSLSRSSVPFMIIHSDVWGPSHISSLSGTRWFVTFIDDCTRMTWVCPMKSKSEVSSLFKGFHKQISTQYNATIQVLRSDNGGEYMSTELQAYFKLHGIIHQTTCAYTPQQNGVAERKNRHLLEIVRASLISANTPTSYWGEALSSAVYIINRIPSAVLDFRTPFEVLSKFVSAPTVSNLPPRVFGCVTFVHLPKEQRNKLEPRALKCVFVGYASSQKGYRCYHPPTQKVYVTMDVTFHEENMYFHQTELQGEHYKEIQLFKNITEEEINSIEVVSTLNSEFPPAAETTEIPLSPDEEISETCPNEVVPSPSPPPSNTNNQSSTSNIPGIEASQVSSSIPIKQLPNRTNRGVPKPKYDPDFTSKAKYPMSNYVSYDQLTASNKSFVNQLSSVSIPNSVQEAICNPKWKSAMDEEMKSLLKNDTWVLTELPAGKKKVGCKWVYTVKYKADGTIERFKARLVAKGYTQTHGIDYLETFAPVAKINTVRVLLSLAANLGWSLQQFDVKNAFLHGELEEEVYMEFPPGYKIPAEHTNKVCKLKKSLYGLKQSPRAWFGRFTRSMRKFGYSQSNSDHTLFLKKSHEKITVLIVYVDDMVLTGNDPQEQQALKKLLSQEFEMKDLGDLKYFLGIEVSRSSKGIFLSQRKYALDLLSETGMLACQPSETPMEEGLKLELETDQVPVDKGRYQRLVGRLMYLAHTRPDISYALSIVSQFLHNPGEKHMQAVMRIISYLKATPGKGILFQKNENFLKIEGYTDADWAGNICDRRSTSGYFTFVGGNLVTWRSKKQNVVSRSSAEAEYRGMAIGIQELLWLKLLLTDLGFPPTEPMMLYCDNKAACDIAHNPVQHDRTKHVEVDRFFIKEKLEEKVISVPHVRSEDQLADILTKPVTRKIFAKMVSKLGMFDICVPT
ncbi:hypothetical protein LguiA_023770 [Lonicera macranthoides]